MAVVKTLKALCAVPRALRTKDQQSTIERAAEFMLLHHIYKSSHDAKKKAKPGWLHFGFPLMYQTDVLEILDILVGDSFHDSRLKDAYAVVLGKQTQNGRWLLENTYASDRLLVPMGTKGEREQVDHLAQPAGYQAVSEHSDAS